MDFASGGFILWLLCASFVYVILMELWALPFRWQRTVQSTLTKAIRGYAPTELTLFYVPFELNSLCTEQSITRKRRKLMISKQHGNILNCPVRVLFHHS